MKKVARKEVVEDRIGGEERRIVFGRRQSTFIYIYGVNIKASLLQSESLILLSTVYFVHTPILYSNCQIKINPKVKAGSLISFNP